MCNNCHFFYTRKTEGLKQGTRKHKSDVIHPNDSNIFYSYCHKSDVIHPNDSNCKKCSEHLRTCSKMEETFQYLPVFV